MEKIGRFLSKPEDREIKGKGGSVPFNSGAFEHILLLTNTEVFRLFNRDKLFINYQSIAYYRILFLFINNFFINDIQKEYTSIYDIIIILSTTL